MIVRDEQLAAFDGDRWVRNGVLAMVLALAAALLVMGVLLYPSAHAETAAAPDVAASGASAVEPQAGGPDETGGGANFESSRNASAGESARR